jgi:peptide-methionine (S)-S-oxide reductase
MKHFVNGATLEGPFPGMETAIFGMGCFWGAERKFWEAPGVVSTAVGYAGGTTPAPTYEDVCGCPPNAVSARRRFTSTTRGD